MTTTRGLISVGVWVLLLLPAGGGEPVEIVRDRWGVPHVFAASEARAMYGLGYATAADRGFQMHYTTRIMQGRLAELLGDVSRRGGRETALQHDRKMRTFGFHRAARQVVEQLDAHTRELLEAYSGGVNAWFAEHRDSRHELYAAVGLEPEPWTPADSLLCWWHLSQFFGTDGTRDLLHYRNLTAGPPAERSSATDRGSPAERAGAAERGRVTDRGGAAERGGQLERGGAAPDLQPLPPDEATAVVGREDVAADWLERVACWLDEQGHGAAEPAASSDAAPKFSHAWVAGGRLTGTGAAVLVSEPRTPVTNPSLLYEFHVCGGAALDARGVGIAGSPILLIGWNRHVAWGMTALGADQADLFRLHTDAAHPEQYLFEDQWRPLTVHREQIQVRGGAAQSLVVRSSHLGPIVNEFAFAGPEDPLVALKRIPVCETDRETIQGALAMMRAGDVHEFHRGLGGWRFPSANVVFGDSQGNVGFSLAGALVLRSPLALDGGAAAHDGSASRYDWSGVIPHELLPHTLNPPRGYVFSANHRPIGSFYPVPLGVQTGSLGDTLRSWRLRELLADGRPLTPERLREIRVDAVNPARREIVRLGYHLRDVLRWELSADALQTLQHLESWYREGAASRTDLPGSELAMEISTFFRFVSTDLAWIYGGGESGLSYFLKSVARRLDESPRAELSPLEQAFIDRTLAAAWNSAVQRDGTDPLLWPARAAAVRELPYFEGLAGFPGLDPRHDLVVSPVCTDGGTLWSQTGQAYSQWVPLHAVDEARSLLPPGNSEDPRSGFRTSGLRLWQSGELHPAPLSREAVAEHAVETIVLP